MYYKGSIRTIILMIIIGTLQSCANEPTPPPETIVVEEIDLSTSEPTLPPRENITFILGEDHDKKNPYYKNAEQYYRYDAENFTETVIVHIRSLSQVQDYLREYAVVNKQPWGLINLVSHGNPYVGMSVNVEPDGVRSSPDNIIEGIDEGVLRPLAVEVIDDKSRIMVHGCGLGDNSSLIDALNKAFIGEINEAKINVSRFFEYYVLDRYNSQKVQQFQADYWIIRYKMGYRPSDGVLISRFENTFPDSNVDWQLALSKERATEANGVFNFTFDVPLKWIFKYESMDSIPSIRTKSSRLQFATNRPEIMEDLNRIEIKPEKFNWWMRKIHLRNDDGTTTPALWVKGYCTMMCVLKLRPEEESDY